MSDICSIKNLKLFLPFIDLMIALWDEINKSGKVSKKDEDKIYNEANRFFKDHWKTDEDLPFDFNSTLYSIKLLWLDPQGALSRLQWATQNYTTQHEFIEISGKNGCIYTIGLYVDLITNKPYITMNDFSFTSCTIKNKNCAEDILKKGHHEYVETKTITNEKTKTKKDIITYQVNVKDKKDCNILCKNMVNMRDDDRNKYTPISHIRQELFGSMMEGILNIDHIKILQYLIHNSNELNYRGVPTLKVSMDQADYSQAASFKLKNDIAKKILGWLRLGAVCSKETEYNCRTFAEDFYSNSSKLFLTLKSLLPEPKIEPKMLEYVDVLLPFTPTPKRVSPKRESPKRKSKSLTPKASQKSSKRKSKSVSLKRTR